MHVIFICDCGICAQGSHVLQSAGSAALHIIRETLWETVYSRGRN